MTSATSASLFQLHAARFSGHAEEEREPLLAAAAASAAEEGAMGKEALALPGCQGKKGAAAFEQDGWLFRETLQALDLFKGILVILMTYAHVDLCLVNPVEATTGFPGHLIGNAAAAMCFLGFMFAYGYACDYAYLAEDSRLALKSSSEGLLRLLRSAFMPIGGAWLTSFGWAWICFKMPVTWEAARSLLTLYYVVGNGPDFLICFTVALLIMYAARGPVNRLLGNPNAVVRAAVALGLILGPLSFTYWRVHDCTGMPRKYLQFFLPCEQREAWTANLPALPHLFYFNLGLLASRGLRGGWAAKLAASPSDFFVPAALLATVFGVLAMPLASAWEANYGNLMVHTRWGWVIRGFVDGPSCLYLLGNLFALYLLMIACLGAHLLGKRFWLVGSALDSFRHLGANILFYLVAGDLMMAGMYRALAVPRDAYPVHVDGAGLLTLGIIAGIRFLHYLASSSRS